MRWRGLERDRESDTPDREQTSGNGPYDCELGAHLPLP
jgi:hypothetical protein